MGSTLPLPQTPETELTTPAVESNGMNAAFGETIHCVAAEPHATFLRVSVIDGGQDVAYETAVLGRLRPGYRVFQLRGMLGTRIELCYLFVRISFGSEPNLWPTARQLRVQSMLMAAQWSQLQRTVSQKVEEELSKRSNRPVESDGGALAKSAEGSASCKHS